MMFLAYLVALLVQSIYHSNPLISKAFIRLHLSEANIKSDDDYVMKQFAMWHQPISVDL